MPNTNPHESGWTIKLRVDVWFALRKTRGLDRDADMAALMRVTRHTLQRVQAEDHGPGGKFIGGALAVLDDPADRVTFARLFQIVPA